MIKLFWNTHNQKISAPNEQKDKKDDLIGVNASDENRDLGWGIYHKNNSNIWIEEILKKINYKIIKNESEIEKEDILIIVDSSVEKKK